MTEKIDRHEAMCVKIDDFHSDYELCYILVRILYASSLSVIGKIYYFCHNTSSIFYLIKLLASRFVWILASVNLIFIPKPKMNYPISICFAVHIIQYREFLMYDFSFISIYCMMYFFVGFVKFQAMLQCSNHNDWKWPRFIRIDIGANINYLYRQLQ